MLFIVLYLSDERRAARNKHHLSPCFSWPGPLRSSGFLSIVLYGSSSPQASRGKRGWNPPTIAKRSVACSRAGALFPRPSTAAQTARLQPPDPLAPMKRPSLGAVGGLGAAGCHAGTISIVRAGLYLQSFGALSGLASTMLFDDAAWPLLFTAHRRGILARVAGQDWAAAQHGGPRGIAGSKAGPGCSPVSTAAAVRLRGVQGAAAGVWRGCFAASARRLRRGSTLPVLAQHECSESSLRLPWADCASAAMC